MKKFAEFINESYNRKIELKHKRNPNLTITFEVIDGKIYNIQNNAHMRFPYIEGQYFNRNMETWCCNNNFLLDGKDTCTEPNVFGIRTKDIPQGHELRYLFPHKFKK
jgi:hypothetical protein